MLVAPLMYCGMETRQGSEGNSPTSFASSLPPLLRVCVHAQEQEQFLPDCLCWALPCLVTSAAA